MPKLTKSVPKYRLHKASGQAVVTIQGQDIYLGPWQSEASQAEYDCLIGEWLSRGRPSHALKSADISVTEVVAAYWQFAKAYYVKDGKSTSSLHRIKVAMRAIRRMYGQTDANQFGPKALKSLQMRLAKENHSRRYVNDLIDVIKRMFKWAASEELVSPVVHQALATVAGLRKGRSEARETEPVCPVSDQTIDATLPHLPGVVADMVRFQRLTGCRPGEACKIRPCDVDTAEAVWTYIPSSHKTEHRDQDRTIFIGPKAQQVLGPYLLRDKTSYCFSPSESERKRRQDQHALRRTPLSYGNRPGTNLKRNPKRRPGRCYNKDSYRRAIYRACDRAFPPPAPLARQAGESKAQRWQRLTPEQRSELERWEKQYRWSPNQIRHSTGTEIRKRYGLEAAQVVLGHAAADVTQIYAERDLGKAREIMGEVG